MPWLHQHFHHVPTDEDGDAYVEQYMCAYILSSLEAHSFQIA